MKLVEMDILPGRETGAVLKEVKKFSKAMVRPAGVEMDSIARPGEALAEGSALWEVLKTFRKLDLHLMGIPEELGGMGGEDWMTSVVVAESLGHGDPGLALALYACCAPFAAAALSSEPGPRKLVKTFCKDYDCTLVGCMPPAGVPRAGKPTVFAKMDRGRAVINGSVPRAANAPIATHALVEVEIAGRNPGAGYALVPLGDPGVTSKPAVEKSGQRPLPQGGLAFDNVKLPKGFLLASTAAGHARMKRALFLREQKLLAAVFSGVAMAAFEEAQKYAAARIQGGVPIIEHDNIRLQFFHMAKDLEAARAAARRLAQHLEDKPDNGSALNATGVRCLAMETAARVVSEAMQIFGGYGLTKEFPLEKMFRDVRSAMVEQGDPDALALAAMAAG
ncbi:MAG: acyl-CoA/acyl-ACP dehydrogenase [Deltaproteobacteria bacterium]|nr:acyl-CoA/acyl-ACP dehydrogenase [Deltaproteobacteria bacterium]